MTCPKCYLTMKNLGVIVDDQNQVSRKWQCPICNAIHYEDMALRPPARGRTVKEVFNRLQAQEPSTIKTNQP